MSTKPCDEGGDQHAYVSTGLDNIDATRLHPRPFGSTGDVLCTTRRCIWCGQVQAKPYGQGGGKPWRKVTSTPTHPQEQT